MPQIRIRRAAELLGVSDDTVRRWIEAGTLTASTDPSGRQVVDGVELARLAKQRAGEPRPGRPSSGRNHLEGLVTAVTSDRVMSSVELQCGPHRIVALVSTEAVQELGLEPGVLATARIKATNVIVEPGQPE